MKKEQAINPKGKKEYQVPTWQKEPMFERFTLACATGAAKTSTVVHCSSQHLFS
jgi:hypothetical protein